MLSGIVGKIVNKIRSARKKVGKKIKLVRNKITQQLKQVIVQNLNTMQIYLSQLQTHMHQCRIMEYKVI